MTAPARRKAIELPAELFVGTDASPVLGMTVNLSEGGMLILSEAAVPKGSEIRFRFARFEGRAEVIWAHEGERGSMFLGMHFTDLSRGARGEIDDLLDSAELEYRPGGRRPRRSRHSTD